MATRQRRKRQHSHDSMWTSYADLFLGLSVIFLLLYVTASIRQGTDGVRQFIENNRLAKDNQDLKHQLKVYESLKQNYLETQAQQGEQETYDMLMSKLQLLQEEAKDEKEKLRQQAMDNEQKEKALNQYQQIVRNIINANVLAKARIKNRDVLITKKEDVIEDQTREITDLESQLTNKREEIEQGERRISALETAMDERAKQLRAAFKAKEISEKKFKERQKQLQNETAQKIAALREQNQAAEQEMQNLSSKLQEANQVAAGLASNLETTKDQLGKTQGALGRTQSELGRTQSELGKTKSDLAVTKSDLARAQENLNARRKLADAIKGKFKNGGVHAEVDGKTGDVLLSFEGEYFDTGKARLKPGMKKVLERAMPAYAQSLFEDPKIAQKIENVEIVGFASPTYKGKYIDPSKLGPQEREAVNYNLELSFDRARSIFDHVYTKMSFTHKQRLLPLVKVTGRSFLADKDSRNISSEAESDLCRKIDCAKKQTVIIRFKLKD